VHWGTFCLAMHAWDQPAEVLHALAPKVGARLAMPRLGEPIEPAHIEEVRPWWRAADDRPYRQPQPVEPLPAAHPGAAPRAMPWPID